jgi:hypothetical protein
MIKGVLYQRFFVGFLGDDEPYAASQAGGSWRGFVISSALGKYTRLFPVLQLFFLFSLIFLLFRPFPSPRLYPHYYGTMSLNADVELRALINRHMSL